MADSASELLQLKREAIAGFQAGRLTDALDCFRQILARTPGDFETLSNLGAVLARLGRIDEAIPCFQRALAEAATAYQRALALRPDDADVHFHLGQTLLAAGDFTRGWPEYEWRWRLPAARKLTDGPPPWQGEPLAGRRVLLRAEQGFGDTLMFLRFAAAITSRGGQAIVECLPQIASLAATCPGVCGVTIVGQPLPACDCQLALGSLPGLLGSKLDSISTRLPYVFPRKPLIDGWKAELADQPRFKVGLAWQGNPGQAADRARSFALLEMAPLFEAGAVQFVSLQAGTGSEQLRDVPRTWPIRDFGPRLGDFERTAALVQNLDLVITCDSAPAHLAGALGVPVWLALPYAADWRWLINREDSPWYPTMRLFRQTQRGRWADVFECIARDLRRLAGD
jgi:hypothetical protein